MAYTLQELGVSGASITGEDIYITGFTLLTSVILPDNFVVRSSSLRGCPCLTHITVHPDNPEYSSEDGVLFNKKKTKLMKYPEGRKGDYTIPDSVIHIGEYLSNVFDSCTGLTSVFVPKSVTSIAQDAFRGCTALHAITVHPGNPRYASEDGVLFNKKKTKLFLFPEGRQGACFIPASVVNILEKAFDDCPGLISFSAHPDNPKYASEDGVLFNKNKTKLMRYPAGRKGDYVIPDSVFDVDEYQANVFENCRGLTSVVISSSMTEIKDGMFSNCTALTTVFVSKSVERIECDAFADCTALQTITVHPDNTVYASEDGVLFDKNKTRITFYPFGRQGDYVIPNSVTIIGHRAFLSCAGLTAIKIPDTVVEIRDNALEYCDGLTSINIPDSVAVIGNSVFGHCTGLTAIHIPHSVETIGDYAFAGCTGLTSISISDSVKEIGCYAFSGCSGLATIPIPKSLVKISHLYEYGWGEWHPLSFPHGVTVHPDNPMFASEDGVLFDKNKTVLISYPNERQGDYIIPDSVIEIGMEAFRYCSGLTSVTIPKSVIEMNNAFDRHVLFSVHPDNPVFASDDGVLFNKEKTEIIRCAKIWRGECVIPDTVEKIERYVFSGMADLTSVTIPASIAELEHDSFGGCIALTSITVHPDNPFYASHDGVLFNKEMTELIFYPEGRQGEYVIPDTVVRLGECAFKNCVGLTSIVIPDTVVRICDFAFENCPAIIMIHPDNPAYTVKNGEITEKVIITEITNISVSLHLTHWLRLEQALQKEREKYKYPVCVTKLTVSGTFAERDFRYIRENMADTLQELDISNVSTKKNRIPCAGFSGCSALTSVSFSETAQLIDCRVFTDCANLTAITIHPDNSYYASENGVLFNKDKTVLIKYPLARQGDYVIPASVAKIEIEAFRGCTGLTSVTIPDSVSEIVAWAFCDCVGLTSVIIPDSVIKIGYGAFDNCPAVFSVHPDNPVFESENGKLMKKF